MATPSAQEANQPHSLWRRLIGAREAEPEAELFGPRGKLPRRGEPDTDKDTALRILVGHIVGDGELAVRLPSLIAGTLVIPALYELGREMFDRRTGLIAAAFGTVSPLLIWYAQEARMYAFVTLFGLLAVLTQVRVIRKPTPLNWAAYILATSALLWSHYFGLLLIGVQQVIFVGLLIQRRSAGESVRPLALGYVYSLAVLVLQLI